MRRHHRRQVPAPTIRFTYYHTVALLHAHVVLSEQKLPIKIRHINCVHIDDVDVLEPAQSQSFQYFTAQSASADDEDAATIL